MSDDEKPYGATTTRLKVIAEFLEGFGIDPSYSSPSRRSAAAEVRTARHAPDELAGSGAC